MKTISLLGLLAILSCPWLVFSRQGSQFSLEKWEQDYQALKKNLETGYANLEWMRQARKLDLAALDAETRQSLSGANSDAEGRRALEKFLAAFGDGHLRLRDPDKPSPSSSESSPSFDKETPGAKPALGAIIRAPSQECK